MQKKTFIFSWLLMAATFIFILKIHSGANVEVVKKNLDHFPYQINNMVGTDIYMEESVVKELNTDVYIFRTYSDKKGKAITLYIGYYGTKKGGRTGHNPFGCFPGGGWTILEVAKVKLPVLMNSQKKNIEVNSMQVKKGSIIEKVYHWYQSQRDKVLTSGIDQNLNRFKNKLLYNRNDGAFIRVSATIKQDLSATKNTLENFIKEIFPLIVRYWPIEKKI